MSDSVMVPVMWQARDCGWKEVNDPDWWQRQGYEVRALYAAPPPPAEAPPLTVEEVARVIDACCWCSDDEVNGRMDAAQAIVRMAEKGGAG